MVRIQFLIALVLLSACTSTPTVPSDIDQMYLSRHVAEGRDGAQSEMQLISGERSEFVLGIVKNCTWERPPAEPMAGNSIIELYRGGELFAIAQVVGLRLYYNDQSGVWVCSVEESVAKRLAMIGG